MNAIRRKEKQDYVGHTFQSLVSQPFKLSPRSSEVIREPGLKMLTRPTLNDYTHWVSAKPLFSHEVDVFPQTETKVDKLQNWQRYQKVLHFVLMKHECFPPGLWC